MKSARLVPSVMPAVGIVLKIIKKLKSMIQNVLSCGTLLHEHVDPLIMEQNRGFRGNV